MFESLARTARDALTDLNDTALALTVVAVFAVLAAALILAFCRGGRRSMDEAIWRIVEERQDVDLHLAERLHAQERTLADLLERRLEASGDRMGEALDKGREAQHAVLSGLAERLGRIDAAQARLTALSSQISNLERALVNKQARGAFGEARLSDLLRDALPTDAFAEQATLSNGRRADALLLLPSPPGPIAIDAKFPLERFLELSDAADDAAQTAARRAFARDVAKHVADIADRYIVPGATADCALMFVPSEAVYAEIHARCRAVVEAGFRRRVFIVSPTTLWATLNTARAILKDARMAEQASALRDEALGLVEDVSKLAGKAEAARRRLELAESDLDGLAQAARAAERRGRRIADLDLTAKSE